MTDGSKHYDGTLAWARLAEALKSTRGIDLAKHGAGKEAAAALGVNQARMSNWQTRGLPIDQAFEFARKLDVDIYYLTGDVVEMRRFTALGSAERETPGLEERLRKLEIHLGACEYFIDKQGNEIASLTAHVTALNAELEAQRRKRA